MTSFEEIGTRLGKLVGDKNLAYGNSFDKCGAVFRILYPEGIRPDQIDDALCLVRIFDKMMRIATKKDAFGESPYGDIIGYGILGLERDERLRATRAGVHEIHEHSKLG